MTRKSQDTRRVPEANTASDPDPTDDEPLCGTCGNFHSGERGTCDLDPMNADPAEASENERKLRESLWALNRAIDPDDGTTVGQTRKERLEQIRDQVWELGQDLYGWTD